jgi:hypothetical protein
MHHTWNNEGKGRVTGYIWNDEIERQLREEFKARRIKVSKGKAINDEKIVKEMIDLEEKENEVYSKIDFSNRLDIKTRVSQDMYLSDDLVDAILVRKYGVYGEYKSIARDINELMDTGEEGKIRFKASIKKTGNGEEARIKKIGIRATSLFSNLPKGDESGKTKLYELSEDQEGVEVKKTRMDLAMEILGTNFMQYDQSASIYTVTNLLNTGVWIDSKKINLYEVMYGSSFGSKVKLGDFGDQSEYDENKAAYKSLAMYLYFDDSISRIYESIKWRYMTKESLGLPENMCTFLPGWDKEKVIDEINRKQRLMMSVIGNLYGSKVFLHESCIYLDVTKKLLESGAKVLTCYDEWYWAYPDGVKVVYDERNILELIQDCAVSYYRRWIKKYGD